jgi:hypothetical protein
MRCVHLDGCHRIRHAAVCERVAARALDAKQRHDVAGRLCLRCVCVWCGGGGGWGGRRGEASVAGWTGTRCEQHSSCLAPLQQPRQQQHTLNKQQDPPWCEARGTRPHRAGDVLQLIRVDAHEARHARALVRRGVGDEVAYSAASTTARHAQQAWRASAPPEHCHPSSLGRHPWCRVQPPLMHGVAAHPWTACRCTRAGM